MNTLISVGAVDHVVQTADASIASCIGMHEFVLEHDVVFERLTHARKCLATARVELQKAKLTLRQPALAELLSYHRHMAATLGEAAKSSIMGTHSRLRRQAADHQRFATVLEQLVGTDSAPALVVVDGGAA